MRRPSTVVVRVLVLRKIRTLDSSPTQGTPPMWLLILEASGALALLIFLVWWTMFSGRKRGEPDRPDRDPR
jgi:hypothetical protein